MQFLKYLFWALVIVVLLAGAMFLSGNYELAERLTSVFLIAQSYLPVGLTFEQFLLVVSIASVVVMALVIAISGFFVVGMAGRLLMSRQEHLAKSDAARRELEHIRKQGEREYQQLVELSAQLAKRLDKRILVQAIVQAASRMTSVAQANSAVSLWLLHFENDTMAYETGIYCDQTFFTKPAFAMTESPFAQLLHGKKAIHYPSFAEGLTFVTPTKSQQLGSATSMMVVPMLIENTVLGALVFLCHPDVLKSYEAQRPYYETMMGELALGLAIAVQGELAILDRLTGVHNREYFLKRLMQEIERANRFQLPLTLLMLDVDNFKAVNDTLGHPQGDAVLKIVSKIIKKEVRAIDLVGRYGGEEFIMLLPETGFGEKEGSAHGALIVAERIRQAIDEEFRDMQKPLNITVSLGAVVRRFPQERTMDQREMIRLADEQLYRAKTSGKNKVCAAIPPKDEEETWVETPPSGPPA